jgi:hypothetical protein
MAALFFTIGSSAKPAAEARESFAPAVSLVCIIPIPLLKIRCIFLVSPSPTHKLIPGDLIPADSARELCQGLEVMRGLLLEQTHKRLAELSRRALHLEHSTDHPLDDV